MKIKSYFGKQDEVEGHLNKESVIRYYLLFLPPKGSESILNIGCGRTDPYGGMLKTRTKKYRTIDIRKSSKVDYNIDISKEIIEERFEWGVCFETLEHIHPELKEKTVLNIMKICQNCVFTYPSKDFEMKDKDGNIINSFYHDPGHTEVNINWNNLLGKTHDIINKSTKNGRCVFIAKDKNYKQKDIQKIRGYF